MTWPTPIYSRQQVNRAGEILRSYEFDLDNLDNWAWAYAVVNNWRSCHGYPINTFQATLRSKLRGIDPSGFVAQRLKRMPSIITKLERLNRMQLSRMQDIGGLRAVVSSLRKVRALEDNYRNSRFDHELVSSKDYVERPKDSGYRCVHLIYRYSNPIAPRYNGLLIELQIRTKLQHAWATAVETMGTFLNQALKASEGPEEWLEFFTLVGSAFAYLEGTTPVPGYEHLSKYETFRSVIRKAKQLDVKDRLDAYTVAANQIHREKGTGSYHLIILDTVQKIVTIRSYGKASLGAAGDDYGGIEKQISSGSPLQAVLVSAGPLDDLRRAYPNYFLDTHQFIRQLDRIERELGRRSNKRLRRTARRRER